MKPTKMRRSPGGKSIVYTIVAFVGVVEGALLHAAFHAASSNVLVAALTVIAFALQIAAVRRYLAAPLGYIIFGAVTVVDAFLLHLGDHLASVPQTRSLTVFALFGCGIVALAGLSVWLVSVGNGAPESTRKNKRR